MLVAALLLAPAAVAEERAAVYTVAAVMSDRKPIYNGALVGLREGVLAGTRREVRVRAIYPPNFTPPAGEDPSLWQGVDLIVPVGSRATEWVARNGHGLPVLALLVPESVMRTVLAESPPERALDARALVIDQPVARHLRLCREVMPQARSLGVLLGPETARLYADLVAEGQRLGLSVDAVMVETEQEAIRAMADLVRRNDMLLALYDPVVMNATTVRALLYASYEWRRPVIGFSEAFVDAGGLAAVYSTPEDIGRSAGELVARLAQGNGRAVGQINYPGHYSVAVNRAVARALRIDLPDNQVLAERLAEGS